MKKQAAFFALFLSACGGGDIAREVSRAGDTAYPQGMNYAQFRNHSINEGDGLAAQKRFLLLDRNNDGILSASEFNGY